MRKKVMSTSKRKWIVSGLLGFGAVALLTTGFATWVVGVQKNNSTIDPSTSVEGTVNKMISLTVEFRKDIDDKEVSISEKKTGEFISNTEGKETDFVVKPHIKIELGKSLNQLPESIKFSLGYKEKLDEVLGVEGGQHVKTTVDDNKVKFDTDTKTHKANVDYEYFKINDKANITLPLLSDTASWTVAPEGETLPKTYTGKGTVDGWTVTETSNSYKYESNNAITMFDWGSFFGDKSPVDYYDELYKAGKDGLKLENTAEDIDFVVNEMEAMRKLFDGQSLKVLCNLTLQNK